MIEFTEWAFWVAGAVLVPLAAAYGLTRAEERRTAERRRREERERAAHEFDLKMRARLILERKDTPDRPLSAVFYPTNSPIRKAVGLFSDETAQKLVRS